MPWPLTLECILSMSDEWSVFKYLCATLDFVSFVFCKRVIYCQQEMVDVGNVNARNYADESFK
jgi:hypothetical protein